VKRLCCDARVRLWHFLDMSDLSPLSGQSGHRPMSETRADIGWIEIPQRSSLLPCLRCAIFSVGNTGGIEQ
jgi:hypothetical protein